MYQKKYTNNKLYHILRKLYYTVHPRLVWTEYTGSDIINAFSIDEGDCDNMTNKDTNMRYGLVVLKNEDVVVNNNGTVTIKNKEIKEVDIYRVKDYNILKSFIDTKTTKIYKVEFRANPSMIINFNDYNSVKLIYDEIHSLGYKASSDADLMQYAMKQKNPRVRGVIVKKSFGKVAFEGSKVKQYKLDVLTHYDIYFITEIRLVNM